MADFIGARNELAARLKKDKRTDDASVVKALAKPSVTAWAVNRLYWNHRKEFDRLLKASHDFRQAQASRGGAQSADMRASLDARREALARLSEAAALLLQEAGYSPAPDTIHRITTTLEAVSATVSSSDGPPPGRLTRDLDPPGFDSLVSMFGGAAPSTMPESPKPDVPSKEPLSSGADSHKKTSPTRHLQDEEGKKARQLEEARQAKISAAKLSLREAERSRAETVSRSERLEAARKTAKEEADQAANDLHDLEDRLRKARAASHEAAERLKSIASEAREAARDLEDARRNVDKASKDLQSLL